MEDTVVVAVEDTSDLEFVGEAGFERIGRIYFGFADRIGSRGNQQFAAVEIGKVHVDIEMILRPRMDAVLVAGRVVEVDDQVGRSVFHVIVAPVGGLGDGVVEFDGLVFVAAFTLAAVAFILVVGVFGRIFGSLRTFAAKPIPVSATRSIMVEMEWKNFFMSRFLR